VKRKAPKAKDAEEMARHMNRSRLRTASGQRSTGEAAGGKKDSPGGTQMNTADSRLRAGQRSQPDVPTARADAEVVKLAVARGMGWEGEAGWGSDKHRKSFYTRALRVFRFPQTDRHGLCLNPLPS